MNKLQIEQFVGNIDQLCKATLSIINSNNHQETRVISVHNGSGLSFDILPDRGMDLGNCFYKGVNIVYLTKNGVTPPNPNVLTREDFIDKFVGGLLTTCGLFNVGPECEVNGLSYAFHGKISNTMATNISITSSWVNEVYTIYVSGTVQEISPSGKIISLKRTISTAYGNNEILISDEIVNHSNEAEGIMLMYHFNLGYPLINPQTILQFPKGEILPRDEEAKKGIHESNKLIHPKSGFKEQVYYHTFQDELCQISVVNNFVKLKIEYHKKQLPKFTQWKMMALGNYVLGLEPGISNPVGRINALETDQLISLAPSDKLHFEIKLKFES